MRTIFGSEREARGMLAGQRKKRQNVFMSKEQLVAELAKLTPEERWEILETFWSPEAQAHLDLGGPTEEDKALLNRETEDYKNNPDDGEPWEIVEARLRSKS
jgi:putative addiction module component (TIGR02574 family)